MKLFGLTTKDLVELWRKTPETQLREFARLLTEDEIVMISEILHDEWKAREPLMDIISIGNSNNKG